MFREMRRSEREINAQEAIELLERCEFGVLSSKGADGYAYGVPLNYVYVDNVIYFHCALTGHKLDNIRDNNKVSFCVVGGTEIIPDKFSTRYESAIVFGTAEEVYDREKESALRSLISKYASQYTESGEEYIRNSGNVTKVVKIDIQHITGKARR